MATKTKSSYDQMGKEWLEFWIRHTISKNFGTDAGTDFDHAFSNSIPILTSVVSVNLERVNKELKFAAQVFLPPSGLGFNEWPKGF